MLYEPHLVQRVWIRWYRIHVPPASMSGSIVRLQQIQTSQGEVIVTNDGATILKHMAVLHPAAKMVRFALIALRPQFILDLARRSLRCSGRRSW